MTTDGPGAGIDGSGSALATCVLAPNPSPMTLDGTNTWLIAAPESTAALVVDPGPDDEGHLRRGGEAAPRAGPPTPPSPPPPGPGGPSGGAPAAAPPPRAPGPGRRSGPPAGRRGP